MTKFVTTNKSRETWFQMYDSINAACEDMQGDKLGMIHHVEEWIYWETLDGNHKLHQKKILHTKKEEMSC